MSLLHAVWFGGPLTELARMSLASYVRHGAEVRLWTYGGIGELPEGVVSQDASELMPEEQMGEWAFGPERQLALFGDQLHWRAGARYGGWCGHLDVTLLRALPKQKPYVFGPHHRYRASFALWRAPQASALLLRVLKRPIELPPRHWHMCMQAFSTEVGLLGLDRYRVPDLVNDDGDEAPVRALFRAGGELPPEWAGNVALHWMASGTIRGLEPEPGSYYARLRDELLG
jgi:hypothetical protein